jgi:hypothetical protein
MAQKEEGVGAEDESEADLETKEDEEADVEKEKTRGIKRKLRKPEHETAVSSLLETLEHLFGEMKRAKTKDGYALMMQILEKIDKEINFKRMTFDEKKKFSRLIENFLDDENTKKIKGGDIASLFSVLETFKPKGSESSEKDKNIDKLSKKEFEQRFIAAKHQANLSKRVNRAQHRFEVKRMYEKNGKLAKSFNLSRNMTPSEYLEKLLHIATILEEFKTITADDKRDNDFIENLTELKNVVKTHSIPEDVPKNIKLLVWEFQENLGKQKELDDKKLDKQSNKHIETPERIDSEIKNVVDKLMTEVKKEVRSREWDQLYKEWDKSKGSFFPLHSMDCNVASFTQQLDDFKNVYLKDDSNERKIEAIQKLEEALRYWKNSIKTQIQSELSSIDATLKDNEKQSFEVNDQMAPKEFLDRLDLLRDPRFQKEVTKRTHKDYDLIAEKLWLP